MFIQSSELPQIRRALWRCGCSADRVGDAPDSELAVMPCADHRALFENEIFGKRCG